MSDFADRDRMTLAEAKKCVAEVEPTILSIRHILDNGDGTYSVMRHINCEFCDYCEEAAYDKNGFEMVHQAKADPYAGRRMSEL